jgi:hypothetical protein
MGITVKRILTDNGKEYTSHTGAVKVIYLKNILKIDQLSTDILKLDIPGQMDL